MLFSKKLKFDISELERSSSLKLLIFTEFVNATYYLSFHYPLKNIKGCAPISFKVLSQDTVRQQLNSSADRFAQRILKKYKPELVIFTRYSLPAGADLMRAFKSEGIPTLYHLDDNLLEIPDLLGDEIKKRQGVQEALGERSNLIRDADMVYLSTSELASVLGMRFENLNIFQGMYAPYLERLIDKGVSRRERQGITIGYMGSKGHKYDLEFIMPQLDKIMQENPCVRFEVFGSISMPETLLKYGDRVESHMTNINYGEFLQYLYELNWDIGLAPLQNHKFNMCKAPTKYLEYTACQIPTIASHVPVYSRDIDGENGMLCSDEDWYRVLSQVMQEPEKLHQLQQKAKTYCESEYSLERLQIQLQELFQQVLHH